METTKRTPSKLTEIGDRARLRAQRRALLNELNRHGWNLTATAEALCMGGSANVIRAIHALDLESEYEAAREDGRIFRGRAGER